MLTFETMKVDDTFSPVLRLCSHLLAEYGALVRLSLDTNVNTSFSQVLPPELKHTAHLRLQGLTLYSSTTWVFVVDLV